MCIRDSYTIDDIQLGQVEAALKSVGVSLEQMSAMRSSLVTLAKSVGGPDFKADETE